MSSKKHRSENLTDKKAAIETGKSALAKLKRISLLSFLFSAILLSFYTIFASAGLSLRFTEYTVLSRSFWILVCTGTVLSILPVIFWRYRIILIITFAIAITLGITTTFIGVNAEGISSDDLYFLDFGSIILAIFFFIRLYRKLPELTITVKDRKVK